MVILVTGGTGFIGSSLCPYLLSHDHKLYVLTRSKSKALNKLPNSVNLINSLSELEGVNLDAIVNLAGQPIDKRWSKAYKKKLLNSRLDVTQQCVDFIKKAEVKPYFLSGSAIGYYGASRDKTFVEDSQPNKGFTHELCRQWEEKALEAQQLGSKVGLLRTGVVLEKHGGALKKMLPAFKMGVGGKIGSGQQWFSWIHLKDMVRIIEYCINHELEGPVNATAPHPVLQQEFACQLAKQLNRPSFLKTPSFMVKLLFGEMGKELLLKGQNVIPKKLSQHDFKFKYPTVGEALRGIFKR